MGSMGAIKSRSTLKTRIKPPSLVLGVLSPIGSFLSAYVVLSIFVEVVHSVVEIYMDDFTPYGCDFP